MRRGGEREQRFFCVRMQQKQQQRMQQRSAAAAYRCAHSASFVCVFMRATAARCSCMLLLAIISITTTKPPKSSPSRRPSRPRHLALVLVLSPTANKVFDPPGSCFCLCQRVRGENIVCGCSMQTVVIVRIEAGCRQFWLGRRRGDRALPLPLRFLFEAIINKVSNGEFFVWRRWQRISTRVCVSLYNNNEPQPPSADQKNKINSAASAPLRPRRPTRPASPR